MCEKEKKFKTIAIISVLVICGGILRLVSCYWGYPYRLHPDEGTIVYNAIDMISRHSYEANVYNRPDHFEIKCCALIFQIVSFVKYHMSADKAFSDHVMVFFLLARAYTAFWGTLMIPLTYKLMGKIKYETRYIAAIVTAFFPVFVQQSAYATPDIVLTFWIMLVVYLSILYYKNPCTKWLVFMCIAVAIGISIKYTCAISCIWIGVVIARKNISMKEYKHAILRCLLAAAIVIISCFFIAPNLFTNIHTTIETLKFEARSEHLGADGLGFLGNAIYYLKTYFQYMGYESILFEVVAVFVCIKWNKKYWPMGAGLLFWICTSVLSLHWERWGMPIYIFFVFLCSIGMGVLTERVKNKFFRVIVFALIGICNVNILLQSILITQVALTKEARVDAIAFCQENGITSANSLYDGYSPMLLNSPVTVSIESDEEGNLRIPVDVEYVILSSAMYNRYYAEPEKYQNQIQIYDKIQSEGELIYEKGGDYYTHSNIALFNLVKSIQGLLHHKSDVVCGYIIKIYKVR